MYGWIHECFKEMILLNYGEEIWNQILLSSSHLSTQLSSKIDLTDYLTDSIFIHLLSSTCHLLHLPESIITEQYSEHFLSFLHGKGYQKLLQCLGSTLFEWLANVNQVHQHFYYLMPQMKPPNIW